MIDIEKLKFGDKIYVVDEVHNVHYGKKITMIDAQGIEWHRYENTVAPECKINQMIYCGRVQFVEEGRVRFNEDRRTELHFEHPGGHIDSCFEDDIDFFENWFHTREDAQEYIDQLIEERS
jgi:hypothetical protein